MPNDRRDLILILMGTVVAALIAATYPAAIPALTFGMVVFAALMILLKM